VSLPKPDEVDRNLEKISGLIGNVREQYPEAYKHGLLPYGGGLQPGRSSVADQDPTGELTASQRKIRERNAVRRAAKKVEQAFSALDTAAMLLEGVVGRRYVQPGRARNALVSPADFQSSLDAKRRRAGGEG
jgi:hypothetical protein